MPVFMKIDGIDSVGRQESVKDGTSNTLMIGEHVLTSVSHAATDVLDELFYSPETAGGGVSVLEFSVENFPNNSPSPAPVEGFGLDRGHMGSSFDLVFPAQTTFPQRDGNAVATESLEIAHEGFLGESDLPAFGYNLGDTAIEATKLPMHPETTIPSALSPDQAVTWTAIAMAESGGSMGSYSDYSLYDLIV